jgi:O-antigen ligase
MIEYIQRLTGYQVFGLIFVVAGYAMLIGQMFVNLDKPAKPGDWTPKQYRMRLILGGIATIIWGLVFCFFIHAK